MWENKGEAALYAGVSLAGSKDIKAVQATGQQLYGQRNSLFNTPARVAVTGAGKCL